MTAVVFEYDLSQHGIDKKVKLQVPDIIDGQGTDEFLRILNTLGDENTFVISHKGDQLVDKFRNSIRFVKQQNFSRIA